MFKSKVDLYGKNWIDTVFEGRNKRYGAYEMRKKEAGITVRALIIGAVAFCLLISSPLIMKKIGATMSDEPVPAGPLILKYFPTPPPPPPVQPVAPREPEVKSILKIKEFTPLVVAPDNEVIKEVARQDEFLNATPGSKDIDGDPGGVVPIAAKPVDTDPPPFIEATDVIYTTVQVEPQFTGGDFRAWLMSNLEGVINNIEGTNELRMKFQFVIERDGSLTGITVLEDGGNPEAANKAKQVLASSPKWNPAVVNGRAVRMLFVIPIIAKIFN